MTSHFRRVAAGVLTLAVVSLPLSTLPADAAPKAKHYSSCSALNKVYKHGVGKKGARDRHSKSSRAVTNFTVDSKVYGYNNGPRNRKTGEYDLDRDNDGIACEKR